MTLFKRHVDAMPRSPEARTAGRRWSQRLQSWFLYYDNGKAAARVRPGARLLSPHEWLPTAADSVPPEAQRLGTNMTSAMTAHHAAPHHRPHIELIARHVQHLAASACVLHYPVWRWEVLWRRFGIGNFPPALRRLHQKLTASASAEEQQAQQLTQQQLAQQAHQ